MPRQQNAGTNHNLLIVNKSFENVGQVQVFQNSSSKCKLH